MMADKGQTLSERWLEVNRLIESYGFDEESAENLRKLVRLRILKQHYENKAQKRWGLKPRAFYSVRQHHKYARDLASTQRALKKLFDDVPRSVRGAYLLLEPYETWDLH